MSLSSHFISILSEDGIILYSTHDCPPSATLSLISVINSSAKAQKHLITRVDNLSILNFESCDVIFACRPFFQYIKWIENHSEIKDEKYTIQNLSFDDSVLQLIIEAMRKIIGRIMESFLGSVEKWSTIPQFQFQRKLHLLTHPFHEILSSNHTLYSTIQLCLDARYGLKRTLFSNCNKWTNLSKALLPNGVIEWAIYKNKSFCCGTCKRKIVYLLNRYNGEIGTCKDIPLLLRSDEAWNVNYIPSMETDKIVSANVFIITLWKHVELVLVNGDNLSLQDTTNYIMNKRKLWNNLSNQFFIPNESKNQIRDRLDLFEEVLSFIYVPIDESYYMFEDFTEDQFIEANINNLNIKAKQNIDPNTKPNNVSQIDYLSELIDIFFTSTSRKDIEKSITEFDSFIILYLKTSNGILCICLEKNDNLPLLDEELISIGTLIVNSLKEQFIKFDKIESTV